jgi:hypothetical protein
MGTPIQIAISLSDRRTDRPNQYQGLGSPRGMVPRTTKTRKIKTSTAGARFPAATGASLLEAAPDAFVKRSDETSHFQSTPCEMRGRHFLRFSSSGPGRLECASVLAAFNFELQRRNAEYRVNKLVKNFSAFLLQRLQPSSSLVDPP